MKRKKNGRVMNGRYCSPPILKAKKVLAEMMRGEILHVLSTDPGSIRDFQAFALQTGNELMSHQESINIFGS